MAPNGQTDRYGALNCLTVKTRRRAAVVPQNDIKTHSWRGSLTPVQTEAKNKRSAAGVE
jgi:hypothetical protein